jgi:TRAP-type uncharacterized transport system fused permease subunit
VRINKVPIYDVILALLSMLCTGYMILVLQQNPLGSPAMAEPLDTFCAVVLVVLALEVPGAPWGLPFPSWRPSF